MPGKIFELAKDMMTIGRDVNNDLVINDSEVSRNHSRLTAQSGGYLIEDLASTNGTFVNGQRLIGPKLLNSGDVVGLGETIVLEYGYVADAGATVIASAPMPMRPAADPVTAPPMMPEPAPMMSEPAPMMAEPAPMMSEPAPMMSEPPPPMMSSAPPPMMNSASTGSMSTPPMAPPPPPMPPKKDNTRTYVAAGCGCLALCGCLGLAVAAYNYLPALMLMLGQ
jgi:predicted component of type VI protein secretion system